MTSDQPKKPEGTKANEVPIRHYVRDYELLVRHLVETVPLDEAMSRAVGGGYDEFGGLEVGILEAVGLQDGQSVIDIGCGSGRLAKHLGLRFPNVRYLGTDVVQTLLDYAARQSPPHFRFALRREINIPAEDGSADFVTAFSVFTHLFHEESYNYLQDAKRVLHPDGAIIFSFLEFPKHWRVFEQMLDPHWQAHRPHVNMFIERSVIAIWADRLGLLIDGYDVGPPIGQSVVVLRKRKGTTVAT